MRVDEEDKFTFPNCMHYLSAALHREMVEPGKVTISLPFDEWWRLHCALERKFRGMMRYDGRGQDPTEFIYMGFRFRIDYARRT